MWCNFVFLYVARFSLKSVLQYGFMIHVQVETRHSLSVFFIRPSSDIGPSIVNRLRAVAWRSSSDIHWPVCSTMYDVTRTSLVLVDGERQYGFEMCDDFGSSHGPE